jgi:CheY-like chemotaxis protein
MGATSGPRNTRVPLPHDAAIGVPFLATILVVDDDAKVRTVLTRMLRSAGHSVVGASDGRQALEVAGAELFDLVVTDILMPEVEGLETITRLQSSSPQVPIIAISGGGRVDGRLCLELASSMGAKAVLRKPIELAELLGAVKQALPH